MLELLKFAGIADELVKNCSSEAKEDHDFASECLKRGRIEMALSALEEWPESHFWLKNELNLMMISGKV